MPSKIFSRIIILPTHSRRAIKRKVAKTGKTIREMFEGRTDEPEDFDWKNIYRVIETGGMHIKQDHYEYIHMVIDEYRDSRTKSTVIIDNQLLQQIQDEIDRTGRSIYSLLDGKRYTYSKPVTSTTVCNWFNGKVATANWYSVSYIIDLYSTLPNKSERNGQQYKDIRTASLRKITPKERKQLQHYRDYYAYLPTKIINRNQDVPQGLNSSIIASWLSGSTKSADPELLKWVLERCQWMEKIKRK